MKPYLATLLLVLAGPRVAVADNKSRADELFKDAKKLMADKQFSTACPKFEESYKLDPGIGGELNIARCYEEWGKLGRAYHAYADAEKQAKKAKDPRTPKIHELVAAIEPLVPRLMIRVPQGSETKGLQLKIDGVAVNKEDFGNAQLVDPGPKQIVYTLPGGFKKTTLVPIERGSTSEVTLELPKHKEPDKSQDKNDVVVVAPSPAPPGRNQRIAGIAVGATGVVLIGVSSYMTLAARSKYNDALAAHCNNATDMCDAQGLADTHDARHSANIATVLFSVGLAAAGGGVALYLLAPKAATSSEHAYYLVPSVTPEGAALAFGGRL
jgi:hypothetical protein